MIALWRPIEITDDNNKMDITISGTTSHIVLDKGVYANIWSLLYRLKLTIAYEVGYTTHCYLGKYSTTGRVVRIYIPNHNFQIRFPSTTLWTILGYRGDQITSTSVHDAQYPPSHCWFPTRQPFDSGNWRLDQEKTFYGNYGVDGSLNGVASGSKIVTRNLKISSEIDTNVYIGATKNSTTISSHTANWEAERSFEHFVNSCRTATLQGSVSDHKNCSPKGFYLIYNISAWAYVVSATWDAGGIYTNRTTSPNKFIFCQAPKAGWIEPAQTSSRTTKFYDLELEIRSSAIPQNGWSAS